MSSTHSLRGAASELAGVPGKAPRVGLRPPGSIERSSDRALVEAARGGDGAAADALVRRHYRTTWRAAYSLMRDRDRTEDVVQDAFERFFAALGAFDSRRPVAPWLHRIAVNTAISVLRRRRPAAELTDAAEDVAGARRVEASAEARALLDALGGLDVDHRATVVLRLILGYSGRETAEILGVATGTVHSRLSRGIGRLRAEMDWADA